MDKITEFPIAVYGQLEKYNDVLSRARCRIFYKGANRNGTYINDQFAEELINSLHYVPVKGIYSDGDYQDHGTARDEGRIYGIVPENPNVQWEPHVDEDGVERVYACADVLLFTGLYQEADEILGKAQSMELYGPSLKYHTVVRQGQKMIEFDHGCFLGLQVLGDEVEPCFEGASFYTLRDSIESTIQKIKEYSNLGGQSEMHKLNFKLSDGQKYNALWSLLNPEYTEESNWTVSWAICDVYDEYALAYNLEESKYARVYYTKNDESDTVEIGEIVDVFVIDVTAEEKATLETLRALNGGSYSVVSETLANAEANLEKNTEYELRIDELSQSISTLNTEASELQAKYTAIQSDNEELRNSYAQLTEEVEGLRNYKHAVETQQKLAVIAEYGDKLSEDVLDAYKAKLDDYTVVGLDKELAYELKKSNASAFTNSDRIDVGFIPKDVEINGVNAILSRYKK